MSTALRLSTFESQTSRRTRVLAAASALVAAASITVTLAVAGGGSEASSQAPSGVPVTAHPDRATLYQRGAQAPQSSGTIDGRRSADRFHHYR
jgi:hypothetical protein